MKNINKIIDHTNIRRDATIKDIKKTCQEAKTFGFRGVCINPQWVKLVNKELEGTKIKVIVLIDPPIGDSAHKKRVKICQKAKRDGADELDVVISVPDVKHERWEKNLNDLKKICQILPTKVIIGSGYLTDDEIRRASELTQRAGAFCVKTATEKDPLEHIELKEKARHLRIMKEAAPRLKIKASGKIKTLSDVLMMIKTGAEIIGTSFGVEILKEFRKKK